MRVWPLAIAHDASRMARGHSGATKIKRFFDFKCGSYGANY